MGQEFGLVAVGPFELVSFFRKLTEQPGVLDGKSRLGGKGAQEIDERGWKRSWDFSPDDQTADNVLLAE